MAPGRAPCAMNSMVFWPIGNEEGLTFLSSSFEGLFHRLSWVRVGRAVDELGIFKEIIIRNQDYDGMVY